MYSSNDPQPNIWFPWVLKGVLIISFLVLLGRLIDLQIIKGSYFRGLSEGNRIRRVPITASRGKILARGGEILVGNKEVNKRLVVDPEDEVISEWTRDYNLRSTFAHLGGYLGEAGEEEVGKIKAECPQRGPVKLGALIGRTGLEEEYECILAGVDGEELIEVDAGGRKIRILGEKHAVSGEDLKTTIASGLQGKVAELMKDKKGAVVVTDSKGEVLALYSSPSFDPNVFLGTEEVGPEIFFEDKDKPLFNRVIGGMFHPGSIFKPIVAISALEEGTIDKDYVFEDKGLITIETPYGNFSYNNWYFTQYGTVEGKITLTRALARSTDTFFYNLGEMLGVDNLVSWSSKFGLDTKTGIDLPGEISGLVPSPAWKLRVKAERWFLGNTYHMAIGQGDIALTPIGVNTAISAIASDGIYCPPHLIQSSKLESFPCKNLGISKESIGVIKQGMVEACSVGGTGYTFFDFSEKHNGITVACKTGTAENVADEPHAWFVAFAPYDEAEIVATVLVENGGEGSKVAGPIAREIFDYWFDKEN